MLTKEERRALTPSANFFFIFCQIVVKTAGFVAGLVNSSENQRLKITLNQKLGSLDAFPYVFDVFGCHGSSAKRSLSRRKILDRA